MFFGDAIVDHGIIWHAGQQMENCLSYKTSNIQIEFKALNNELYFAINAIDRLDGNAEFLSSRRSFG